MNKLICKNCGSKNLIYATQEIISVTKFYNIKGKNLIHEMIKKKCDTMTDIIEIIICKDCKHKELL